MTDEIDVSSAIDSSKKRLDAGEPVPAVEVNDLKYFWSRWNQVRQGSGVAVGMGAFGDDNPFYKLRDKVPVVWFRCGFLQFLLGLGVLKEWQHGEELDDAVFHVAARIAFEDLVADDRQELDVGRFLQRERYPEKL